MLETPGAEPARVAAAVAGPPLFAELVVAALDLGAPISALLRASSWAAAAALVATTVVRPLLRALAQQRLEAADARSEATAMRVEVAFRERMERALSQAGSEPAAIRAALRASHELFPDADVALLVAVPDEPRVGWSVRLSEGELGAARPVPGTPGCNALAGTAVATQDSSALDACAHVEDPDMSVSSVCVPIRLGDRVLGAVSTVQAPGEGPDDHTVALLEWVADRTGARIAELRRLQGRRNAFREDPVTGLGGPDSLDDHLRESFRSLVPFCVALVEIDDFDGLSHLREPAEVDEALRTLADSLRLTLRPDDVICRIDRGRFAAVLGNCGATQASLAIERVRESLALSLANAEVVPFTFSAGVVESHRASSLEDLLEQARSAARLAHGNGGNRVALAHD
ncbi:MAG: GGDEF domain-containing protein [Microthrixaceae bacterium]